MRGFPATPGAVHVNTAHGHARLGLQSPTTSIAKIARTDGTMRRKTLYTHLLALIILITIAMKFNAPTITLDKTASVSRARSTHNALQETHHVLIVLLGHTQPHQARHV